MKNRTLEEIMDHVNKEADKRVKKLVGKPRKKRGLGGRNVGKANI